MLLSWGIIWKIIFIVLLLLLFLFLLLPNAFWLKIEWETAWSPAAKAKQIKLSYTVDCWLLTGWCFVFVFLINQVHVGLALSAVSSVSITNVWLPTFRLVDFCPDIWKCEDSKFFDPFPLKCRKASWMKLLTGTERSRIIFVKLLRKLNGRDMYLLVHKNTNIRFMTFIIFTWPPTSHTISQAGVRCSGQQTPTSIVVNASWY